MNAHHPDISTEASLILSGWLKPDTLGQTMADMAAALRPARMAAGASRSIEGQIEANARLYATRPYKLAQIALSKEFPPADATPFEMLAKVGNRLAHMRDLIRDSSWAYDHNNHIAALAAERCLLRMIGAA